MERLVEDLRARGQSFSATLTTLAGRPIEAEGQVVGGRAILRLKDVGGVKRELAELLLRFQRQIDETEAVRALVEALPSPVWARDEAGKLNYANASYARAVEARNAAEAVQRGIELFDRAAREELLRAHEAAQAYAGRLPAIVAGSRASFDVLAFPARRGSAGIGIEATETEAMRGALERLVEAHRRTLDQLTTGVAIFGTDQRLSFYNTAYRSFWISTRASSTSGRQTRRCSTGCARRASSPSSRISGSGRPSCTKPTRRSKPRATNGTCPTAARSGSSPRPIRKGA